MDPFNGTTINKLDGGLGRKTANADGVSLLVIESDTAPTGLPIGTVTEVISLKAAEALGINASYDDANDLLAHHHISEVFRINPDATLFVLFTNGANRNALILQAVRTQPAIKIIGYVNHVTAAPVAIATQVASFQTGVVNELAKDKILIDVVIIESDQINEATAINAYPDLRALAAPNVAVCIAQDTTVAAIKPAYANYAAIGSALGALSRRGVNENLGSVDINNKPDYAKGLDYFSLTNIGTSRWLNAGIQSGKAFASLTTEEREVLNTKGYIFVGNYAGFAGFYFSNSPVCTAATSDYAFIENNRVWNKAARGIRTALLPRVKRNLLKDPATGNIKQSEVKELEQLALVPLTDMITAEEISGADVYINPAQSLVDETPLNVSGQLQYNGIIFEFNFDLGGTTSIS